MKTITQEQKTLISGRIAKIGLMFAVKAFETDSKEEATQLIELSKKAKQIIGEMKCWAMTEYAYDTIIAMFDSIQKDKDENGMYVMPLGIFNAMEAIFEI